MAIRKHGVPIWDIQTTRERPHGGMTMEKTKKMERMEKKMTDEHVTGFCAAMFLAVLALLAGGAI